MVGQILDGNSNYWYCYDCGNNGNGMANESDINSKGGNVIKSVGVKDNVLIKEPRQRWN